MLLVRRHYRHLRIGRRSRWRLLSPTAKNTHRILIDNELNESIHSFNGMDTFDPQHVDYVDADTNASDVVTHCRMWAHSCPRPQNYCCNCPSWHSQSIYCHCSDCCHSQLVVVNRNCPNCAFAVVEWVHSPCSARPVAPYRCRNILVLARAKRETEFRMDGGERV